MSEPAAAAAARRRGTVVLEAAGALWGVAGGDVEHLGHRGDALRLRVAGGELAADRVLAVVPDLAVTPPPAALDRYWSWRAAGLAVYGERPVLVIDAERPPAVLLAPSDDLEHDD